MALKKPLVFDSGTPVELNSADTLDIDAACVVNESGAAVDFRVEGDTATHLFQVVGASDEVRIGTNSAGGGGIAQFGPIGLHLNLAKTARDLVVYGSAANPLLTVSGASDNAVRIGQSAGVGAPLVIVTDVDVVINEFSGDVDFRVESNNSTTAIYVDASADQVSLVNNLLVATPGLVVINGNVVLNESGADQDFRVEGDSLSHLLFTEGDAASENIAFLATAAPNWQSMDRGLFIGNADVVPSGNPSSGAFLYTSAGTLIARTSGGHIAPLVKPPDIQIFSVPGTYTNGWTKPAGAVTVARFLIGGGGGGGSGRRGATGTVRGGGGGGGGGGFSSDSNPASEFGATETVTVGAGGAGGAGVVADDTNGNAGSAGGNTSMTASGAGGSTLTADGGGGGGGGSTSAGSAGAVGSGATANGANGGAGGTGSGLAPDGGEVSGQMAGGGGGGGAGISSSNSTNTTSGWGGASGGSRTSRALCLNATAAANALAHVPAQAGNDGPAIIGGTSLAAFGGGGGAGGATAAALSTAFQSPAFGGGGGRYGGGGGGGAGYTNGIIASNDGFGAGQGLAIIITYFD